MMNHDMVDVKLKDVHILRPPLRNRKKNQQIDYIGKNCYNIDLKRKFERNTSNFYKQCTTEVGAIPESKKSDSSTSLVLRKTKERNVLQQYSFLSYASLLQQHESESDVIKGTLNNKDKPLIKVTVIPKSIYTQTSSKLYDCTTKTFNNTLSTGENNYKTKNVYLVVAGRKKEKIYEIKTKGSEKIASDIFNRKKISVQRVTGLTHFIETMEKKRKKDKRKKNTKLGDIDGKAEDYTERQECSCSPVRQSVNEDKMESPKSRVRITGRLGITEDDRYILKCAATVDGQPVSSYMDVKKNVVAPACISAKELHQPSQFQVLGCLSKCANTIRCPQESQETQVNFISNILRHDQTVQCDCSCTKSQKNKLNVAEKESDISIGDNSVKDSQSVVVVISVYPKQEMSEKALYEEDSSNKFKVLMTQANNDNNKISYNKKNVEQQQQRTSNQTQKAIDSRKKTNSRSPSPPVKLLPKQKTFEGKLEVHKNTNRSRTVSPKSRNPMTSYNKTVQKRKESPDSNKKDVLTKNTKVLTETKINNKPQLNLRMKVAKIKDNKSTNTDQAITKKMLIDEFMNGSLSNNYKKETMRSGSPRKNNNISNISINIDGEHEFYDVQYRQGVLSTDLKVKKTLKQNQQEIVNCYNSNSPSMENFLLAAQKEKEKEKRRSNRSFSETVFDDFNKLSTLDKQSITLNVRDSLEINHRREEKSSISIRNSDLDDEEENEDSDAFVAAKHFRGDQCSITDPMERDKQIRELLGVDKPRSKSPLKIKQEHNIEDNRSILNILKKYGESNLIETKEIQTIRMNKKIQCKIQRKRADMHIVTCKKSVSTQYETSYFSKRLETMCVNNVQTLLHNQVSRNRPIVLSRKQYEKMKKTLQIKLSRKRCCRRCSGVSVGEIRRKIKQHAVFHNDKEIQTDQIKLKCKQIQQTTICFQDPSENSEPAAVLSEDGIALDKEKEINEYIDLSHITESNDKKHHSTEAEEKLQDVCYQIHEASKSELNLINDKLKSRLAMMNGVKTKKTARQTVSSIEIHYASIAYKHVTFSRSTIGDHCSPCRSPSPIKESLLDKSIHTIYKRQRKSLTPNLGTSAFSLFENTGYEGMKAIRHTQELKTRKPLLKRIMSYLVMRSTHVADVKIGRKQEGEARNARSFDSVDSYLINSSLGEMEITSSLYDTSASFFSNHAIYPINSKIKRGFLSSVRGLLTNRK